MHVSGDGTGRHGTARRGDVGPSRARACAGRGRDRAHDPEAHPWGLGLQRRGRQAAVAGPSRAHRPGVLHADAADGGQQRATGPEWGVGRGRVAGFLSKHYMPNNLNKWVLHGLSGCCLRCCHVSFPLLSNGLKRKMEPWDAEEKPLSMVLG